MIGIFALLMSLYYLGAGITEAVTGDKLSPKAKKVFGIINISLFSALFMAALVLTLLFDVSGNPITLGSIDIVSLVIYALYGVMLLESLTNKETEPAETPSDNVQEEAMPEPEGEKEPESKTEEEPTPEQGE